MSTIKFRLGKSIVQIVPFTDNDNQKNNKKR
jgi:hypothetical protein